MIQLIKEPLYSENDFERGVRNGLLLTSAFFLSRIKHPALSASVYPASFLAQLIQSYRHYRSKSADSPVCQALCITSIKHILYLVPGLRELEAMSRLSKEAKICFLKCKTCLKKHPEASKKKIASAVLLHSFNLATQAVWTGKVLQMSSILKSLRSSCTQSCGVNEGKK